jgi:hypothetical protein
MSDDSTGNGNGKERVTLPLEALTDEITITFRRADGTLNVGGRICNLEVALDMCNRAARHFEQQIRLAAVLTAKQQLAEQQRVQDLLQGTIRGRH